MGNDYDGTLISCEGIDGSGKSTAVDAIRQWADSNAKEVVTTAEPTDTRIGRVAKESIKDDTTSALTDFFLFCTDRVRHCEQFSWFLENNYVVVVDRYVDSTRAYQTHRIADQMGMSDDEARSWMNDIIEPTTISPDITIYLDTSVETALERADGDEQYEKGDSLRRAKEAYDALYDNCDADVRIINGEQSIPAMNEMVINTVKTAIATDDGTDEDDGGTYSEAITDE